MEQGGQHHLLQKPNGKGHMFDIIILLSYLFLLCFNFLSELQARN